MYVLRNIGKLKRVQRVNKLHIISWKWKKIGINSFECINHINNARKWIQKNDMTKFINNWSTSDYELNFIFIMQLLYVCIILIRYIHNIYYNMIISCQVNLNVI